MDIINTDDAKRIDINIVPLCGCTINVPANCNHICS